MGRGIDMRFEDLSHARKVKNLKRLHSLINTKLFGGTLQPIAMDVALSHRDDMTGHFRILPYPPFKMIILSHEYVEALKALSEYDQKMAIGQVIIHEAVHQWCYEHGVTDDVTANHGGRWEESSEEHRLMYWTSGEPDSEDLTEEAIDVLNEFTFA